MTFDMVLSHDGEIMLAILGALLTVGIALALVWRHKR
jgi:hypothetical protein